jgi:hypothetical protein
MDLNPKQAAIRAMARYRVFRMLPPGAARIYAGLRYHGQNSTQAELAEFVGQIRRIPTRHRALALAAARAAFRTGHDDLLVAALDSLEQRFPDAATTHELRADLHTYHGRYTEGLRSARRATELDPTSGSAAARVVKLGYWCLSADEADLIAVDAVRRFPVHSQVLWTVAKACRSAAQYARIRAAWDERNLPPVALLDAVRQLSMAAARGGEVDAAQDLYRRAITVVQEARASEAAARVNQLTGRGLTALAGRNAWNAIEDLRRTLDDAGVPFFLAAGTALGFVREGGPLKNDNDIDVGVFDRDWDRDALAEVFTRSPMFELDAHPQSEKLHVRHRGGSPIDLFRFYREGDRVWHDGVFVRWFNTPFTVVRRTVRGVSLPLPEDADTYLTENYGDWRTPNGAFDPFTDDAPNVEITWPEYQRMHFVRRAYKQIASGDIARGRRSLELAGEAALLDTVGLGR